MKKDPWIPAPCNATGKRLRNGRLAINVRRRSVPIAKTSAPIIGRLRKVDKIRIDPGADNLGVISDNGSGNVVTDVEAAEREIDVLLNLRRLKTVYFEATSAISAQNREVALLKSELKHARLLLDSEKEARTNAEIRAQRLTLSLRDSEKIIEDQRKCLRDLWNDKQRVVRRTDRIITDSAVREQLPRESESFYQSMIDRRNKGLRGSPLFFHAHIPSAAPNARTADHKAVQTSQILHDKTVQTKSLVDQQAQTTFLSLDDDDGDKLAARQENSVFRSHLNATTTIRPDYCDKTKESIPPQVSDVTIGIRRNHLNKGRKTNESSEDARNEAAAAGAVSRERLTEILNALQTLEDQLKELKKQLSQQKRINIVFKQYIHTLVDTYASLFSS